MKITKELANSTIKASKKDSIATKISIFLAVLILGVIVFIIGDERRSQYEYMSSTVGNYQVELTDIDGKDYDFLTNNKEIDKVSFSRFIEDKEINVYVLQNDKNFWATGGYELISGKKPSNSNEILVSTLYLNKHNELDIGSEVKINEEGYTIVGKYDDYGRTYSFEGNYFYGFLDDTSKENLFKNKGVVSSYLWFTNPRDTYSNTKNIMSKLGTSIQEALEAGKLNFNTIVLEHKMIYPNGFIPPRRVVVDALENYGGLLLLVLLFATIVYGAFNVWNDRDMREMALLKSIGMTDRQIKKMVRYKAMRLSVLPVLAGTAISYLTANLLLYLMWWNNSITYKKMSDVLSQRMIQNTFEMIQPSLANTLLIVVLAFLMVYLSALVPAKKSSRIKVVEGLSGIREKKVSFGKSEIDGKIEKTLAKDYFVSYRSTYRVITVAMVLSALVLTRVLISQSYRQLVGNFDTYKSSYNLETDIVSDVSLDENLVEDIENVEGLDEQHIFSWQNFNISLNKNSEFLSDELVDKLKQGVKSQENLFVSVYGLSEQDFESILEDKNLNKNIQYLMLNKIPEDDKTPYAFRKYINISDSNTKELVFSYNKKTPDLSIKVGAFIDEMPFDVNQQENSGIYLFTKDDILNKLVEESEKSQIDPIRNYKILIKSNHKLGEVSDQVIRILSNYLAKSDYSMMTDLKKSAINEEENRNITLLTVGMQVILLALALSNAYNSFHSNLRARRKEFHLLSTVGMTKKQLEKMIYLEGSMLIKKGVLAYLVVFLIAVVLRTYRSKFEFTFAVKEIILGLNYIPIILIFLIMAAGIFFAVKRGGEEILDEDTNSLLREI